MEKLKEEPIKKPVSLIKIIGLVCLAFLMIFVVAIISNSGTTPPQESVVAEQKTTTESEKIWQVMSVSDYPFTLDNQPAVSIAFGESQTQWCSITIKRENIVSGYVFSSVRRSGFKDTSFDCNLNGKQFVESENHDTYLKGSIDSVDSSKKIAVIKVSFKLIDYPELKTNFEYEIFVLLKNKDFDNLIKKI